MMYLPRNQPTSHEENANTYLVDYLARHARTAAESAVQGREGRFRQLTTQYAHLGRVAEQLLCLSLRDLEVTPLYFEAITRVGLQTSQDGNTHDQPKIIQGKVAAPIEKVQSDHE